MQNIFSYHIENKDFSPFIVKRSFKVYLEQFDPEKNYLLKEEVIPFLELKDAEVTRIIKHYEKDRFDEYRTLNALFIKAIDRQRKIRAEVQEQLLQEGFMASPKECVQDYPRSEEELRHKILCK